MENQFVIYITNDQNFCLPLPVNPTEVLLKGETDDKSETIIDAGEYNRVGEFKLRTISIESVIPENDVTYLNNPYFLDNPKAYIDYLQKIYQSKKPTRVIIPALANFSADMTISSLEYGFKNSYCEEYYYTLDLKEYKPLQISKKANYNFAKSAAQQRAAPPKKIGIGSIVIVNGQLHRDSYGSGPGDYEQNARRKISIIASGRPYPYHVTLENGGWRGWVRESDVRLA